jgi:thioredoxin 1
MITNTKTFQQDVLESKLPVLVDFFATWCGPCKMLAPALDQLSTKYAGRVTIAKVDVDESGDLAGQYGISAVPTLLLFQNGQVTQKLEGVPPMAHLTRLLDAAAGA